MKIGTAFLFALVVPSALWGAPKAGEFLTHGPTTDKRIALTFDDGPGPQTKDYLDLLDKYGVKATFFMLAEQAKDRPAMAKEVAARGHEIASHTYNHLNYLHVLREASKRNPTEPDKATADARQTLVADMTKSRKIIEEKTGARLSLLRMPHGIDRPWIKEAARETGFVLVNWTYGSDWLKDPEDVQIKAYTKAIKPGAILLLHDGGSKRAKSLAITEGVLKAAKEAGYEMVTAGDLLGMPKEKKP